MIPDELNSLMEGRNFSMSQRFIDKSASTVEVPGKTVPTPPKHNKRLGNSLLTVAH